MNKQNPQESKQENPNKKEKENTMALKIGKDTVDTWRARFYAATTDNPGDLIGTLLLLVASVVDETVSEETPMDVVFEILRDNIGNIAVQGMLTMQFSEMIGEVKVNDATAKRLSTVLYDWLKSESKPRTKAEIAAKLFPGVLMDKNPQARVDLEEAYRLIYVMPGIHRFTKDGDKADKRWTTMQFVAAKPAPLIPPAKQ